MDSAITRSAILVFLILLGYGLKQAGLFKQSDSKVLSNIMLYVTLPAVLVNAFRDFTPDPSLVLFAVLALAVNIVLLTVGWRVAARKSPMVRATYMICMAGFNIGSFAIPFLQNLFPQQMMEVILFDIGNSIMNCGIIYAFAAAQVHPEHRFRLRDLCRTLFSTFPFDLYIVLLALALLQVPIPAPIYQLADTVEGANALVVMLMLGILFEVRLDREKRRQVLGIVVTRYTTAAVLSALIVLLLPAPMEQRLVAVGLVCAPISSMATVFCGKLGCDPDVYGTATSLTIPISIAVMLGMSLV